MLFRRFELRAALEERDNKLTGSVESVSASEILSRAPDHMAEELCDAFRVEPPVLRESDIQASQEEAQVDVSHDPQRFILDRSSPFYLSGTRVSFHVPFDGIRSYSEHSLPASHSVRRTLMFEMANWCSLTSASTMTPKRPRRSSNASSLKSASTFRGYRTMSPHSTSLFARKRSNGLSVVGTSCSRTKVWSVSSAILSVAERKHLEPTRFLRLAADRALRGLRAEISLSVPEPALELAEYNHIISIIDDMVKVMERSPAAFKGMKEEHMRTHFLVQLNAQYEGQATGETFNNSGKTDILIRADNKNVFVAETKFWSGPKGVVEALDQLLSVPCGDGSKPLAFRRREERGSVVACDGIAMERTRKRTSKFTGCGSRNIGSAC